MNNLLGDTLSQFKYPVSQNFSLMILSWISYYNGDGQLVISKSFSIY